MRKAGNIEVTKYKLMDLPGKFFLCCSHFPDWTSKDDDHRYIPHDAIPAYFDCNPLSKSLMHAYAKIALGDDEKESGRCWLLSYFHYVFIHCIFNNKCEIVCTL